jgi:ferredoxin-NADP reductase
MGRLAKIAEALLTPHGVDRYLELIDPMLVRRELRAVVTGVRRPTADTVSLTLRPSRAWRGFRAGQYVRVSVYIDGVWRTRCYSPTGSAHRAGLELMIKAVPRGLVSGYLHARAEPGLVLGLSEPDGRFILPTPRPDRILLVSGGSGITPVLSMLRTLADEDHQGEVVFLHYANTGSDVPHRDELAGQPRYVRVVLGYTHAEGGGLRGFFSAEHLERAAPWYRDAETYLCGPEPLMKVVREVYAAEGLSERLHTEEFTAPPLRPSVADANGRVRFARSGREIGNSGRSLLEQAEAAGLKPEHGCRRGICFSCTQVKARGSVRNVTSGEVSHEDNEEIQLCISVPLGDVELNC